MKSENDPAVERLYEIDNSMRFYGSMVIAAVSALIGLGLVLVYSAGSARMMPLGNPSFYLEKQVQYLFVGLIAAFVVSRIDYHMLLSVRMPSFVMSVLMLATLLFAPFGNRVNGAQRWFKFGGYNFQPSEMVKILMIVFMAGMLSRIKGNKNSAKSEDDSGEDDCGICSRKTWSFSRTLLLCAMSGAVAALIAIEPDLGTSILLLTVMLSMIFAAGARFLHLLALGLVAVPPAVYYVATHSAYVVERIQAWLEGGSSGKAYHAYMSMMSLSSGGLTGTGPGSGWAKLGYVPEAHTDFILSIAGQEFGLAGTVGIVIAFALMVYGGWSLSRICPDAFGRFLTFGVTLMLGLQAAFNIAVVTGSVPTKGISLPFVSFGGSGLVCSLVAVGLLVSVSRHAVSEKIRLLDPDYANTPIRAYFSRRVVSTEEA